MAGMWKYPLPRETTGPSLIHPHWGHIWKARRHQPESCARKASIPPFLWGEKCSSCIDINCGPQPIFKNCCFDKKYGLMEQLRQPVHFIWLVIINEAIQLSYAGSSLTKYVLFLEHPSESRATSRFCSVISRDGKCLLSEDGGSCNKNESGFCRSWVSLWEYVESSAH